MLTSKPSQPIEPNNMHFTVTAEGEPPPPYIPPPGYTSLFKKEPPYLAAKPSQYCPPPSYHSPHCYLPFLSTSCLLLAYPEMRLQMHPN